MEVGESILDALNEQLSLGDSEDMEMMDVEEGEVVDGQISGNVVEGSEKEGKTLLHQQDAQSVNNTNKKKRKKKKNKRKPKSAPGSIGMDIDRFVVDVCKRLRERKSYLVYTAIGVLGISALGDLVNEVYAIQACGGQKTAEGNRYRTGGGILWNILKTRDPNAYKEIMNKGKDFERQFKHPRVVQAPGDSNIPSERSVEGVISKATGSIISDGDLEMKTPTEEQRIQPCVAGKRRSVHDRIRVPVSYDDLPGEASPKNQLS